MSITMDAGPAGASWSVIGSGIFIHFQISILGGG